MSSQAGSSLSERLWIAAAVVLWIGSLPLDAIGARGGPTLDGFEVLIRGWTAWRDGVFAWYANPALGIAVVTGLFGWYRVAVVSAILGLVLAASTPLAPLIVESQGRSVPELSYLPGFYCWMTAHVAVLVGGIIGRVRTRRLDTV